MTIKERAYEAARKLPFLKEDVPLSFASDKVEEALRQELEEVASTVEAEAARREKMYEDLGMDGKPQTTEIRKIAESIRARIAFQRELKNAC